MTRYELLDRIGVGGMAEIFRGKAVAAGGFEKPVAIKRILPHLSQDKRFVELLIAEAKVLSLLKHRNIVQIFDVGLGDDGQYFLVMEYVDGKDLGAVQRGLEARRRRMPFDLALHVGAEICEALEHAHSARAPDGKPMSLVHRDVSPSNVLLSRAGEVKLTDFGIAKRAEQEATGHGAVRGKFAYISPEQARNEHIDPRSDVFSVGILLWELITNRRLFSGLGDLEALRAVREAQVPRPLDVDPRLSPEIDQLLLSALARDLTKRPTAGQFGAKLRSMRYSLEVTVGDPATELAKIIDTADEVERQSQQLMAPPLGPPSARFAPTGGFAAIGDHTEATVIRIRTADEFSMRDKDGGMARARQVIDQFEEEETRQAQLSSDQLRILRGTDRDSAELTALPPPALPGVGPARPLPGRSRRPSDEPTTARSPLHGDADGDDEAAPGQRFEGDESTRLVARSRDRRTPPPAPPLHDPAPASRGHRPSTQPPPPGTVHSRNPRHGLPGTSGRGAPMTEHSTDYVPGMAPLPSPIAGPPPGQTPMMFGPPPTHPAAPPAAPANAPSRGVQPRLPPRGASPTARDAFEQRPVAVPQHDSTPRVAGFGNRSKKPALKPWMLVVGALVMAALAFVVTRAFLSS